MSGPKIVMPAKLAGIAPTHGCHDCKNAHIREPRPASMGAPAVPGVAECRAHSPQAFLVGGGPDGQIRTVRVWPPIQPGDFCYGDWKLAVIRPDGRGPQ